MLEFVNVSKSFWTGTQRKVILDRASFRVELGNSLGILAPNGTGKTTIINMMAGLEIEEYFDMPVGTYSQGMRARFTFALMLSLDFDIYLIDEGMPQTTDAEFNRKAGEVLKERLATTTVIIVSHQAATLEKFARSAAVLRDGQLIQFDTLEEAKEMYDYETQSTEIPDTTHFEHG